MKRLLVWLCWSVLIVGCGKKNETPAPSVVPQGAQATFDIQNPQTPVVGVWQTACRVVSEGSTHETFVFENSGRLLVYRSIFSGSMCATSLLTLSTQASYKFNTDNSKNAYGDLKAKVTVTFTDDVSVKWASKPLADNANAQALGGKTNWSSAGYADARGNTAFGALFTPGLRVIDFDVNSQALVGYYTGLTGGTLKFDRKSSFVP
jgi:hypothetical protein